MKAASIVVVSILALFLAGCVTGDEITSYVIEPDGAISFSIYRLNLTSDQAGEKAKQDLADYIREVEEKRGGLFTKLEKVDAGDVETAIIRRPTPASVLITGRIPSLSSFAAYISEDSENSRLICTAISRESTRGLAFELTKKSTQEGKPSEPQSTDRMNETRIALAEGSFISTQGFLLAHDKRSALLDKEAISKWENSQAASVTLSLEWEVPELR